MNRKTIQGLENYFGPIPTAFKIQSNYGAEHYYIQPWWLLILSKYQRDNLAQLLNAANNLESVISIYNTGNWIAEILYMLSKPTLSGTKVIPTHKLDEEDIPNATGNYFDGKFINYLANKIMKADKISYEEALAIAERYINA